VLGNGMAVFRFPKQRLENQYIKGALQEFYTRWPSAHYVVILLHYYVECLPFLLWSFTAPWRRLLVKYRELILVSLSHQAPKHSGRFPAASDITRRSETIRGCA
jgi:hypothetical protein